MKHKIRMLILTIIGISLLFTANALDLKIAYASSCMLEYGIGSYEDFSTNMCKCSSGYTWGTSLLGKPQCISMSLYCSDTYGYHSSYNSLKNGCVCNSGYVWAKDSLDNDTCKNANTVCTDKLGYNAEYDSSSESCVCRTGYVLSEDILGNATCKSGDIVCTDKYGIYSEYNSLTDTCGCESGYTFDENNQCVKKQNNVYFLLKELDVSNKKAIITSNYDYQNYLIGYGFGCYNSYLSRYLGKLIVVNLGTDFDLDNYDKIVLQDDDETCNILSREKVDSGYSMITLEESDSNEYSGFSQMACPVNSTLSTDSKCYCNNNMVWDELSLSCKEVIVNKSTLSTTNLLDFSDVYNSNYKDAISYVKAQNIVNGYADGTYKPGNLINRAEFTKIVMNALSFVSTGENCFIDVQNQWFAPYVCTAKEKGILGGYPDGTFKPESNINQAEALKILINAFSITPSNDKGSNWYDVYTNAAKENGLFFKLTQDVNKLVSRGEMAQFISNIKNK